MWAYGSDDTDVGDPCRHHWRFYCQLLKTYWSRIDHLTQRKLPEGGVSVHERQKSEYREPDRPPLSDREVTLLLRIVTLVQSDVAGDTLSSGTRRQLLRLFQEAGITGESSDQVMEKGLERVNNRLRSTLGEVVPAEFTRPIE
jgi:hypothetical protein